MRPRRANSIDEYVAMRIRALRMQRGLAQKDLAERLGVSFQQVQKYERGDNRIAAGRLFELAQFFAVPIQELFPELPQRVEARTAGADELKLLREFSLSIDGWRLFRAFVRITSANQRKKIIALVEQIVNR